MPVEPWIGQSGAQLPPAPSAPPGLRWRPLVIAALAVGLGAAGAYIYARVSHRPIPAPGAGSAAALVVAVVPDAAAALPVATDAAVIAPPADAPPVDAAPVEATVHEPAVPARPPAPPAPAVVKPSGPPGFITIDSTPVYATIRIDGKNYGETPVVNIPLSPGRHRVHAVTQAGGTRDVWITIESGKVAPASRIEW